MLAETGSSMVKFLSVLEEIFVLILIYVTGLLIFLKNWIENKEKHVLIAYASFSFADYQ